MTIIPGNHDRYTCTPIAAGGSSSYFGEFSPRRDVPVAAAARPRHGDPGPRPDPRGRHRARETARPSSSPRRATSSRLPASRPRGSSSPAIIPSRSPTVIERELTGKPLINARHVREWLATDRPAPLLLRARPCRLGVSAGRGPRPALPQPGRTAALRTTPGEHPPGFLEIVLDGRNVTVHHHAWTGDGWEVRMLRSAGTDSSPSDPGL